MLCCVGGRRIYPSGKLANGRFIGPYIKLWGEVGEGGVHYKSTNTCVADDHDADAAKG